MAEVVHVLLVEDNPGDARLVERLLAVVPDTDFAIETRTSLTAAIERLRRGNLDVVLLDLSLPDSDAEATFSELMEHAGDLPIVVLTGRQDRHLALDAVRHGAHDVLSKRTLDTDRLCRALLFAVQRRAFAADLRAHAERYSLAFAGSEDGLWDWDLESDTVYYSSGFKSLLGFGAEELGNRLEDWFERVHEEDRQRLEETFEEHRQGLTARLRCELRMRLRSGHDRWMLVRGAAVRDATGTARRLVGSLCDIHERKLTEERLEHDALHDALTGQGNSALLRDRIAVAIAQRRRRPSYHFSLLYLDLDRLKPINDSLGHGAGDQLLQGVAARLQAILRPGDTLARLGGDEFAILADGIGDPRDASRLARRIHRELAAPFSIEGHELTCSASIGITLSSKEYHQPDEMLRDADAAMYRAKALGRGQHVIFDDEMQRSAVEQLRLESDLRRAVERREFQLHYQPIVSLSSGRIEGFEALLRWRHPHRGLIYPEEFIDVAESTGLILPLGWQVLEQACRQMAIWNRRYPGEPLVVSVNLSPRQFLDEELYERVTAVLTNTGLPPRCLRLEVTERPLVQEPELSRQQLARLAEGQVRVSIDDFGIGYSLLSGLHRLPAEAIKIDRSLLLPGPTEEEWGLVETLVGVARHLGLRAAAEGLETEEQVERLRALRFDSVQGYYFSAPLDGAGAEALLAYQKP